MFSDMYSDIQENKVKHLQNIFDSIFAYDSHVAGPPFDVVLTKSLTRFSGSHCNETVSHVTSR